MYKIKEITAFDIMALFFMSYVKISKKAYSFYTNTLFERSEEKKAFKIILDNVEYSKLFNLSIKNEYKAGEFYLVHVRDVVKWQIFENALYKSKRDYLFNDIILIRINKKLDISFLEIYTTNKNFIKKLNSMLSVSQTSWKRKANLSKQERNYLFRLSIGAFNDNFDQFAERREQNEIIKELSKIKENKIYAEDLFFLTGNDSELKEIETKEKELIKEWDNLVYTDKQYTAPKKQYILNKRPKFYTKRTEAEKAKFDEYGMLL